MISIFENSAQRKEINRLAIPAIFMGIAEPVISLVDVAFIGQTGTSQLAAVGIASGFYLMSVWILAQTLTAVAAIVSRYYGQGDLSEIKSLVPQALLANVLLGFLYYLLTSSFSKPIFGFYNAEGEILQYCIDYFSIRSAGFPFTLATMFLFGTFRGLQNTSWSMWIAISGAVLNLVLDYVLIFGIENFIPALGLTGAAYASLVSQGLMFALSIYFLLTKTPFNLRVSLKLNPNFKWLARMSADLFARTILLNLTFYLATRYATGYGDEVIAAHTIALNIWLFSSFFIDGYANAGNAMAGRLLGLKKRGEILKLGITIGKIAGLLGIALGLIYLVSYGFLASVFTGDEKVISAFNAVFWLVILSQPINAIAFAYDGIYKGLGETKALRNLLAAATILGFLPIAVGSHYLAPSLMGIWVAFTVWMLIRSSWLVWDFNRRFAHTQG